MNLQSPKDWSLFQYRMLRKAGFSRNRSLHILVRPAAYYQILYEYINDEKQKSLNDVLQVSDLLDMVYEFDKRESKRYCFHLIYYILQPLSKSSSSNVRKFGKSYLEEFMNHPTIKAIDSKPRVEELKKNDPEIYNNLPKHTYTIEDWENLRMMNIHFVMGKQDLLYITDRIGRRAIHTIPDRLYDEIEHKRREITEKRIQGDLDWYIKDFKRRLANSILEEEEFTKRELDKQIELLTNPKLKSKVIKYNGGNNQTYSHDGSDNIVTGYSNQIAYLAATTLADGEFEPYKYTPFFYPPSPTAYFPKLSAFAISRFKNYLESHLKEINTHIEINPKRPSSDKSTITAIQYALYYYYLQRAEIKEWFENEEGGKVKAIKRLCSKHNTFSAKRFQIKYNEIINKSDRTAISNKTNLVVVIELLEDYPLALKIAKEELNIANSKRGNPIT